MPGCRSVRRGALLAATARRQSAQDGERLHRIAVPGSVRAFGRTLLHCMYVVPWRDRPLQQHFVFHQFPDVQGLGRENRVNTLVVGSIQLSLVSRKTHPVADLHRPAHRAETAQTPHQQPPLDLQFEARLAVPHPAEHPKLQFALPIDEIVGQPRQPSTIERALTFAAGTRERDAVDDRGVRHKPRIILPFPSDVKAETPLSMSTAPTRPELILASTSPYRRALLERLGLPCRVLASGVDETPLPGEAPAALAARLALAKAQRVHAQAPGAVVIGADQVADLDGAPLNKPEQHALAVEQLRRLSGRTARFHSALCVIGGEPAEQVVEVVTTAVRYRPLTEAQIERYLAREPAYDCAGAARIEALGIALVESVHSDDPSALIGLPLIATVRLLSRFGIEVP